VTNQLADAPPHVTPTPFVSHLLAGLALASLGLAAGCGRGQAAPSAAAPGPVEVGVVTLASTSVMITNELPGRTSAFRVAEVRARVNGIVLKRLFTEGSDVREGQLLYRIDPAPYRAALESAKAQLARAEANVASARVQAQRYTELVEAHAVSQQEHDDAIAKQKAFEADVAAGRAAVQAAQINLGYTSVTSPVSGRIGRSEVTEGAYVQQGQATLLATVQQLDPVYVDLSQSSSELLQLRRDLEAGRLQGAGRGGARVTVLLEDGSEHPQPGALQFSDATVDPSTGAVALRAIVPNPAKTLLPGLFVRARLEQGMQPQAILVPQIGVARDPKGRPTALVVNAANEVELRVLQTDRAIGDQWLIRHGVKAGDRVIVEGVQKVRPGTPVRAVAAASAATPSVSSAPSAPAAR
jgi:membrane fusion protein (multidrug efflux system)